MQTPNPENSQLAEAQKPKDQGPTIRLNPLEFLFIIMKLESDAFKIVKDNDLKKNAVEMLLKLIQDDFDGALQIADEILQKKEIYRVYIFKYAILVKQNKLEEGLQALEKAFQIKPISRKINFLIGMGLKKQQKYQEAIKYCLNSIFVKQNCNISYEIGLLYQLIQEHHTALQHFTTACDIRPKNKFYIAKMNSFKALKLYDEALECCRIAILAKPQKSIYYIYKKDLLFLMGKNDEADLLGDEICKLDAFYTLEHFQESILFYILERRLENERVLLQKRQSQVRKKPPTQSQIISKKEAKSFQEHFDAFYYTFAYFFVNFTEKVTDIEKEIAENLSTKQIIKFENFQIFILHCLKTLFPDIERMDDRKIQGNLLDWVNSKFQKSENCPSSQYIFQLLSLIIKNGDVQNQIMERLQEDFMKKFQREKKQHDLILLIGCVCKEFKNIECLIFDSTAGQLGLEHALLLLGYMIIHSSLSQDQSEDLNTIIWRLFVQKDLNQLFQSQSVLKTKMEQDQQRDKQLKQLQNRDDSKKDAIEFLTNISMKKKK